MSYYNAGSSKQNQELTELLNGKIVEKATRVTADEGFTIHFTDGTKLQVVYSGSEGFVGVNEIEINCCGVS